MRSLQDMAQMADPVLTRKATNAPTPELAIIQGSNW